jgi:hypothetical protein
MRLFETPKLFQHRGTAAHTHTEGVKLLTVTYRFQCNTVMVTLATAPYTPVAIPSRKQTTLSEDHCFRQSLSPAHHQQPTTNINAGGKAKPDNTPPTNRGQTPHCLPTPSMQFAKRVRTTTPKRPQAQRGFQGRGQPQKEAKALAACRCCCISARSTSEEGVTLCTKCCRSYTAIRKRQGVHLWTEKPQQKPTWKGKCQIVFAIQVVFVDVFNADGCTFRPLMWARSAEESKAITEALPA